MLLDCVDFISREFGCSRDDSVASFLPCRKKDMPDDVIFAFTHHMFKYSNSVFYSSEKNNYFVVFFDGKRRHFYKCINQDLIRI